MAARRAFYVGCVGLQSLQGLSVDIALDDLEESESVCLLQDATALLHDAIRLEKGEPLKIGERMKASAKAEAKAVDSTSASSSKGAGKGAATKLIVGGDNVEALEASSSASKPKAAADEDDRLQVLSAILLVPVAGLLTYLLSQLSCMRRDPFAEQEHWHGGNDCEVRKTEQMDEDTYTFAVASLTRDAQRVAQGNPKTFLFVARACFAVVLLIMTIGIQAGLVLQVKWYVTPQQVDSIRGAYDAYELHMYGGVESHTTLTVNGKHRGIPGYFEPKRFETLDDDLKGEICNIPMSRLSFFGMVLAVWSLTCMVQLRKACDLFWSLVVVTPTISSMSDCLIAVEEEDERFTERTINTTPRSMIQHPAADLKKTDVQYMYGDNVVIAGLTAPVKALVVMGIILPWVSITGFLLWLGCRWLTATNDFGNLISNAVALEFILYLKDLVYLGLVTERNKRELRNTKILPDSKRQRAGYQVYLGALVWGLLVLVWLWAYIFHLQRVLPEYRWDVKEVCGDWYAGLLARPA